MEQQRTDFKQLEHNYHKRIIKGLDPISYNKRKYERINNTKRKIVRVITITLLLKVQTYSIFLFVLQGGSKGMGQIFMFVPSVGGIRLGHWAWSPTNRTIKSLRPKKFSSS